MQDVLDAVHSWRQSRAYVSRVAARRTSTVRPRRNARVFQEGDPDIRHWPRLRRNIRGHAANISSSEPIVMAAPGGANGEILRYPVTVYHVELLYLRSATCF